MLAFLSLILYLYHFNGITLRHPSPPASTIDISKAYGSMDPFYTRRARVTEIRNFGAEIVSWKRLDNSTGDAAVLDLETLWAAADNTEGLERVQNGIKVRGNFPLSGCNKRVEYRVVRLR